MMRALILGAALLAAPASAFAANPPGFVEGLGWAEKPSAGDLARHYPKRAMTELIGGHARIICKLKKDGHLRDCQVAEEGPAGYGFGQATVEASQYFRMTPTTPEGVSGEGAVVVIPMIWALPDGAPPPLAESYPGHAVLLAAPAVNSSLYAPTAPCPTAEAPTGRCPLLYWKQQPSAHEFEAIVRQAGDTVTMMECRIDEARALRDCAVDSSLPAEAQAALIASAAGYEAMPEAVDKTPTAGKRVRLRYNWAAIRRYLDVYNDVYLGK